ncbi:hypothetical protein R1flu_022124 [Riccia fluitans]|uniref:Uncharacterized protein n=1 Tax=Riccia fluitans TaxID=41844 RepID=A0ABD1ZSN5_9MARC
MLFLLRNAIWAPDLRMAEMDLDFDLRTGSTAANTTGYGGTSCLLVELYRINDCLNSARGRCLFYLIPNVVQAHDSAGGSILRTVAPNSVFPQRRTSQIAQGRLQFGRAAMVSDETEALGV